MAYLEKNALTVKKNTDSLIGFALAIIKTNPQYVDIWIK